MYHSVSRSNTLDPHQLRVHPDRLHQQLRTLARLGLHGVSLNDLVEAETRDRSAGLVGLTFDDGYTDFFEHAAPVLREHGMGATVFVVAGRIGGRSDWDGTSSVGLMDADQVRATATEFEVGSHSLNHIHLGTVSPDTINSEVRKSRAVLEDLLERPVTSFSYPYGSYSAAAVDAVRDAGYHQACVTRDYSNRHRFALPRFFVGQRDTALRLVAKLARHHAERLSLPRTT